MFLCWFECWYTLQNIFDKQQLGCLLCNNANQFSYSVFVFVLELSQYFTETLTGEAARPKIYK